MMGAKGLKAHSEIVNCHQAEENPSGHPPPPASSHELGWSPGGFSVMTLRALLQAAGLGRDRRAGLAIKGSVFPLIR